jgi:hypothetical protein
MTAATRPGYYLRNARTHRILDVAPFREQCVAQYEAGRRNHLVRSLRLAKCSPPDAVDLIEVVLVGPDDRRLEL